MRLIGGSIAYMFAGAGPALLLIHGLGGTRKTWRHLIDDLARTHTVIAPDLPGHGDRSAGRRLFTGRPRLRVARSDLVFGMPPFFRGRAQPWRRYRTSDRLSVSRAHRPAASHQQRRFGPRGQLRYVARCHAPRRRPGRRRPQCAPHRSDHVRAMATVPGLVSGPDAGQIADVLSGLRDSKQRTAFIRTARSGDRLERASGQRATPDRPTARRPGACGVGAADTTIPPDHHRAFANRVPEAVTVEIAGTGHYPHETDSNQLLKPMQTFLSSTVPFEYSEKSWLYWLRDVTPRPLM